MKRTITIDGRELVLKTNGGTLRKYKRVYGRDPLADFMKMDGAEIDVDVVYDFFYLMAKTGNPDIAEQDEWLEEFDELPLMDILTEMLPLIQGSISSTVESKKKARGAVNR